MKCFAKMAENNRFGEMSSTEIDKMLENATSKSTKTSTKFGIRILHGRQRISSMRIS